MYNCTSYCRTAVGNHASWGATLPCCLSHSQACGCLRWRRSQMSAALRLQGKQQSGDNVPLLCNTGAETLRRMIHLQGKTLRHTSVWPWHAILCTPFKVILTTHGAMELSCFEQKKKIRRNKNITHHQWNNDVTISLQKESRRTLTDRKTTVRMKHYLPRENRVNHCEKALLKNVLEEKKKRAETHWKSHSVSFDWNRQQQTSRGRKRTWNKRERRVHAETKAKKKTANSNQANNIASLAVVASLHASC